MSIFDKQEWVNAVEDMKRKAAEFTQLFDRVRYSTPQTPELVERRRAALSKAETVKGTIEQVTRSVDWVYSKWNEYFGEESDSTLQSLGIVPLIPIAVISGAVAGITYSVTEFKKYLDENTRIEQLRGEGYSTEDAITIANQPRGMAAAIERGLKSYGPWIAAGFALWLITQRKFKL